MIRPPNDGAEVWPCPDPVDFGKQSNGAASLVQDVLGDDPFSEALFVFSNRRRHQATFVDLDGTAVLNPDRRTADVAARLCYEPLRRLERG